MKVAVIGSRTLTVTDSQLAELLPAGTTEIISGGAVGVDTAAELYADTHRISKHIILPDYGQYGRRAPTVRDMRIVRLADIVVAIWDGTSTGTAFSIKYARELGKPVRLFRRQQVI